MSQIVDLKNKDEKEEPEEVSEQSLQAQGQEGHLIEPQLVTYQAESLYHEWEAPEFVQYDKDRKWYTYVASFTVASVVLALFFKSNLSALIFGLIGVIILVTASNKPRLLQFTVSPVGVTCGEKHYPFEDIESFWIHYNPEVQEISFKSKKILSPYIKIPLGDQDPNAVRNMLIGYIPEEKQEEEIAELIMRKLKY